MRLAATLAATAFALAGCMPVADTPPSDNRQLLPARGGRVSGDVRLGSRFGPFSSLNDDCSVQSHARVKILSQPANGSARVTLRRGVAAFEANNSFARCNGAPITGTYVEYTPRDGYTGTDRFRFEVVFADGERRVLTPELTVRPR